MAEIKTTNAVNTIEIIQSGKTGGIGATGATGATGPPGVISASSALVITGSLFTSGSGGHITASGNISASGNIYASDYIGPTDDDLDIKSDKNINLYLDADDDGTFHKLQVYDENGAVKFAVATDGKAAIGAAVTSDNLDGLTVTGGITATGNITASGNISASGTVYASSFESPGENTITINDSLDITGNITASGNISASGDIIANNISASGDIVLDEDQRIYFELDKGTWIETDSADRLRFVAGGIQMLLLDQDDGRVNIGYGQKLGVGLGNHTTPTEVLTVDGNISASGNLYVNGISASGHITASGDISSSGTITAEHFYSSDDLVVEDQIKAKSGLFNPDATSTGDFRVKSLNLSHVLYTDANKDKVGIGWNSPGGSDLLSSLHIKGDLTVSSSITASGDISSSGTITGFSASFARINFDNAASQTTVFSGSATQTGSIGHMIIGDQSLQIGGTSGTRFTKTNLDDLKEGRSIRDTAALSAKTYTLDDGREIDRKYEQRFNRWAPNLSFEDDPDGAVSADFSETDSIPQTYADLSDRQFTAVIQQGLTKYVQTTTDIAISSSAVATNTAHIHSPNIILASGRTDNQALVSITGSLSISGSNTFTNWGNFKNRMHQDRHYFTVTTNPWATGGWKKNLGHSVTTPALTGSAPHLHVQLSGSGQVGVGTLAPEHTLHISASSNNFNALQVEGASQFNGFAGGMTFANATAISADVVVPSNYNAVLWVSTYNPSITVNAGTNYTINAGADVRIADMSTI